MANTQINIKGNGTTTLATAGKFCDRNIDVNVAVPASGITPTGTKSITTNGEHDVTNFAKANVNVPVPSGYIKPSGTKNITENGTHDVTNFASAVVNVPTPEQISVVRTVTVSANVTGANNTYTLLSGDEFIKKHYADEGFSATLICLTPVAAGTNVIHWGWQGNRNVGASGVARYGVGSRSTNTSTVAYQPFTTKINGTGYSHMMRVNSSGNLLQHLASGYVLPAGTYQIILTCTT